MKRTIVAAIIVVSSLIASSTQAIAQSAYESGRSSSVIVPLIHIQYALIIPGRPKADIVTTGIKFYYLPMATVSELLSWLAKAKPVGFQGKSVFTPIEATTVEFILTDGTRIGFDPAYDYSKSGAHTVFSAVPGYIDVQYSIKPKNSLRIHCPELYSWLVEGWKVDLKTKLPFDMSSLLAGLTGK